MSQVSIAQHNEDPGGRLLTGREKYRKMLGWIPWGRGSKALLQG
jgi:hypothetical protein